MRIVDLERNDLEGALQIWRERKRNGDPLQFEALLMLFDDPRELLDAIAKEERED